MRQQSSLFHFTDRLYRARNLDQIYSAALDAIDDMLGCTRASILRFDEGHFDIKQITVVDAVNFAGRLFSVTNKALPQTEVSATHDCSLLSYQNGFQWIDDLGLPIKP